MTRASGILLHPTCLPGRYGIGDLGESAYRFADFLVRSRQSFWQVLPLGPPGYGNSPYQCFSSMAGNPLLIGLDALARGGLLDAAELEQAPALPETQVDFGSVIPFKWGMLKKAAYSFFRNAPPTLLAEFEAFCARAKPWLDSFADFMALKDANGGVSWTEWKHRDNPDPAEVLAHKWIQFEFFRQWSSLKHHCNERGIQIIGDIPIFVAHDSADVWANKELFDLHENGQPRTIAGVPPDYFSATGQCWGNPLYRWDVMAQTRYGWWIERVRTALNMVDLARLDHFRGFEKYYEIPGGATTAIHGSWVPGPGSRLFAALEKALHKLPFIAEDLGLITPGVEALRDEWGFPGMRVLQFAFGNESRDDPFKPYNYIRNCVVYTGTHDNDTTVGWFNSAGTADSTRSSEQVRAEREFALRYLHSNGKEVHWDFIRAALASAADTAIVPLQDVLGLGSEARMNLPASSGNWWSWRFQETQLKPDLGARLAELTGTYGRLPR